MPFHHQPVLVREVVEWLRPSPGRRYLDGTVGSGGHAAAILEASTPNSQLLGLDQDEEAITAAAARLREFGTRVSLRNTNFAELTGAAANLGWSTVDGVLFDLGVSSHQLDSPERGFSFMQSGPLDMRMSRQQTPTAAELLAEMSEGELKRILETFGQERRVRQIVRAIVRARTRQRIATTTDLAEIISVAVGGRRGERIHPATRTFQALRIAVNHELENLERGLAAAVELLAGGGRLAVISFHSGEDTLVKHYFRRLSGQCICPPDFPVCRCQPQTSLKVLTRRPITPSPAELAANPRSASAKLRVAEKV